MAVDAVRPPDKEAQALELRRESQTPVVSSPRRTRRSGRSAGSGDRRSNAAIALPTFANARFTPRGSRRRTRARYSSPIARATNAYDVGVASARALPASRAARAPATTGCPCGHPRRATSACAAPTSDIVRRGVVGDPTAQRTAILEARFRLVARRARDLAVRAQALVGEELLARAPRRPDRARSGSTGRARRVARRARASAAAGAPRRSAAVRGRVVAEEQEGERGSRADAAASASARRPRTGYPSRRAA